VKLSIVILIVPACTQFGCCLIQGVRDVGRDGSQMVRDILLQNADSALCACGSDGREAELFTDPEESRFANLSGNTKGYGESGRGFRWQRRVGSVCDVGSGHGVGRTAGVRGRC
jgi:hypothetical protein